MTKLAKKFDDTGKLFLLCRVTKEMQRQHRACVTGYNVYKILNFKLLLLLVAILMIVFQIFDS